MPESRVTRTIAWLAALAGAVVLARVASTGLEGASASLHGRPFFFDFGIYYDQARRVLADPPSLHPRWYYPPAAALMFAPLAALSLAHAQHAWLALQLACAAWLVAACARVIGGTARVRWLAAFGLVAASLPCWHGLTAGQVSTLIVVLSIGGLRREMHAPLLAVATALKVIPALYALPYLLRGRLRALLRVGAALLVVGVALPWLVLGSEASALLWSRTLAVVTRDTGAVGADSQALHAVLARWFVSGSVLDPDTPALVVRLPALVIALVAPLLAAAAALCSAWRTHRRAVSDPVTIATMLLALTLLVDPLWVHYFAMLPYAHAVLLARPHARPALVACALSFAASAGGLLACLLQPSLTDAIYRWGLPQLATWIALAGLWSLPQVDAMNELEAALAPR